MKKSSLFFVFFMLFGLFTANVNSQSQSSAMTIDEAQRSAVISSLLKELNDSYIFPDVAKKVESGLLEKLKNKEYDKITSGEDFARKLTEDLQALSHDKHLSVRFFNEKLSQDAAEPTAEEKEKYQLSLKTNNHGFVSVERLQGNIGYISLSNFSTAEPGEETVAAAMNFINNTDALIFDLRQSRGGDPAMVALICSYLFGDKPVHLNDLSFRQDNQTIEFWTKPAVSGKKFGDKDVYVLTSSTVFSAGEEFVNDLKVLKRATIVGETTRGGANPGTSARLNDHFAAFIPIARAVNPITKTNWEGTGVEPDIRVPKELALKTAYLMALNKSAGRETNEQSKKELRELAAQTQKEIDELKKASKSN